MAAVAAALAVVACSSAEPADSTRRAVPGHVVVDTQSAVGALDRRLLGTNVPAWLGPTRLADPSFRARTVELGATVLRMPGGSWSNSYDWLACETGATGCWWPDAAAPTDFAHFLVATGTTGMWTVNPNGTAQEAAALVAFFNGTVTDERPIGVDRRGRDWKTVSTWARMRAAAGLREPVDVPLWEVGNEVYAAEGADGEGCADFAWEDVWTCDATAYLHGDDDHDGYVHFRDAMRAVDPTIAVGAVGVEESDSWGGWGADVLAASSAIDFYVVHHYGFAGAPALDDVLARPVEAWPAIAADAERAVPESHDGAAPPIAVTEYNLVAVQEQDEDALMAQAINALYVADSIGQMAMAGVAMANQWNLANGRAPNGTDYGLLDADTGRPNPQYYGLALWKAFGDELVEVTTAWDPSTTFSAYAGRSRSGISVLGINKTDEPLSAVVQIDGAGAAFSLRADVVRAEAWTADHVELNGVSDPSSDVALPPPVELGAVGATFEHEFPARSATLLQLQRPDG